MALLASSGLGACAGAPGREEREREIFGRVIFLFGHYNAALQRQDEDGLALATSDLKRLATHEFELFVEGLASPEEGRRAYSAFALGFSSQRAAVEPLSRAVEDGSPSVRSNAVAALGLIGFGDVPVEPFRKLLADPDPAVREAALFGLRPLLSAQEERGLLPDVMSMLSDPQWTVRNEALILLQKMRRRDAVAPIVASSIRDAEPQVRAQAATTLGALGRQGLEANPHLIEMLRDDFPKVVQRACDALNAINEKGFDRLYATWRDWYEDELKHRYECADHPESKAPAPGDCAKCGKKLERTPIAPIKKPDVYATSFACPDHPEVVTSSPARCGKPGCGKPLAPRAPEAAAYACPDHPEVVTSTPSRCGRPGCGKPLVPKK